MPSHSREHHTITHANTSVDFPSDDLDGCGISHAPQAAEEEAEDARDDRADLGDAVRIRVRRGEIIITISAAALTGRRVRVAGAPERSLGDRARGERSLRVGRHRGRRPMGIPAPARAPAGFVGFAAVSADKRPGAFSSLTIRKDLAPFYEAVRAQVRALGGTIVSSGSIRDLREPATVGRSTTSLHYTGRAIDLFTTAGMQGDGDPYLVTRTGGTDANPEWTVHCVIDAPRADDPLFDPSLITEGEFECLVWRRGAAPTTIRRQARVFSLTELFARQGWLPIPARSGWRDTYLSCEWWHFQHHQGLTVGGSRFGDQLAEVWPEKLVQASGLALDAVWAGRGFRAGGAPAPTKPAPALPAEKVKWAATTLNAVAGASLDTGAAPGTDAAAALARFQSANGLQASGVLDASTEVALTQRALERISGAAFSHPGVLDDATVKAIKAFQRSSGLEPDGAVGRDTRSAMVAALVGGSVTPQRAARTARVTRVARDTRVRGDRVVPRDRTAADDGRSIASHPG
ncbi:MAG: peptidoglycan-binding domain-containing protein [Gemmatimonadaceae bacterium]